MNKRVFVAREIAYKKGAKFLAISLDFDLMAEGKTLGNAIDRLRDATIGYLAMCCRDNELDKEIYRKAPEKYFDLYELFQELDSKKAVKSAKIMGNFIGKAVYKSSDLLHA